MTTTTPTPTTTTAVVHDRYGGADVLRVGEVPVGTPGRGEVLVRVAAAAVDRGTVHIMTGLPYVARLGLGLRRPRARVAGRDLAGTVEAVGPDVTTLRPGEAVFGTCTGSLAGLAVARVRQLAPRPAGLTAIDAAAIPVSGLTALQALRDAAAVAAGQRVLVIGASGGVGTYAVQLAAAFGARVTAVCREAHADLARSLGAELVVDYTREEVTDRTEQYDVVLDIAGNRPLSRLRRLLTDRGTLVVVGGEDGGRWFGGLERTLAAVSLSPFVRHRLRGLASAERATDLLALRDLVDTGQLRPVLAGVYPLAEAPDAIRRLAAGGVAGKLVVDVAGDDPQQGATSP